MKTAKLSAREKFIGDWSFETYSPEQIGGLVRRGAISEAKGKELLHEWNEVKPSAPVESRLRNGSTVAPKKKRYISLATKESIIISMEHYRELLMAADGSTAKS